jgi:hypothetical protein
MTEEVRACLLGRIVPQGSRRGSAAGRKGKQLPEQLKLGAQSRYEDVVMLGTSLGPCVFKFRVGRHLVSAASALFQIVGL